MIAEIDFEADAQAEPQAADALQRITAMSNLLQQAIDRVADLERQLVEAKEAQRALEREELPDLMKEFGITSIKLENGASVNVGEEVFAAITEFNRPAAHNWLKKYQFDGIIKSAIEIEFDRDEADRAEEVRDVIEKEFNVVADLGEKIHPATLKSFVKERREADALVDPEAREADKALPEAERQIIPPIPEDLFGIFAFNKAKIVPAKVPKQKKK